MAARTAYAISGDGKVALRFPGRALRDWFLAELPPKRENGFGRDFGVGTCDQYRHVLRREERYLDGAGEPGDALYSAIDMAVPEYWDGALGPMYDAACGLGLL